MQTSESGDVVVTSEAAMVSADQAGADWRESIPEQLRDAPYFKNAENIDQVLADIKGAAFWQGNSILKPGADASDEAKAANITKLRELYPNLSDLDTEAPESVFARLGMPDAADKYESPEGVEFADAEMANLKSLALKSNMTKKQFNDYLTNLAAVRGDAHLAEETARNEGLTALSKEWGATSEGRMSQIGKFLEMSKAPEGILAAHTAGTLGAAEYRWLNAIVQSGDESTEAATIKPTAVLAMTPEQGKQEAYQIRERMFKMKNTDPLWSDLSKQLVQCERYAMAG